jgi:3-carboxy-cis,cis-muconate cycloisomerase
VTPFAAIFVPDEVREAVSDRAWLQGMLDAEHALAKAGAAVGVVPADAAARIGEVCRAELYDTARLAEDGRAVGNPAEPLVRELRAAIGDDAAEYVHLGATSQDIVDTAAMLVSRRAGALVLAELDRLADGCAGLARTHRSTPMAARTLLQQAVPTTFGLKAAGWLVSVLEARQRLGAVHEERLAAQLGGAAGTLAALGHEALEIARQYARELGLVEPVLPWHTNRQRVAELGAALAAGAGAAAKIGRDLVLLAQSEVGEVGEVAEASAGRSSTMPQKRNPVRSTLAVACARLANAHAGVLLGELAHEHERAVGAWHAEWEALSGALAFAGGSAAAAADAVTGLEVDGERMRANLEASGGLVVAERISFALTTRLGRSQAHDVVAESARARSFREALVADDRTGLSAEEVDALLDPTGYLGAAEALVDRALAEYEATRK